MVNSGMKTINHSDLTIFNNKDNPRGKTGKR